MSWLAASSTIHTRSCRRQMKDASMHKKKALLIGIIGSQ
ncbi:Hypothetical protein I596_595 [Dokdonella koreensis DS-123]|uniref:Uncharacterized protein n=1 Tax=Dokdonella koreensis DS-123 TaxID=1300342 RepID=A0A167GJK0_9GAMM|nr:Hypothetical protein I596_595 [Dokdonella koreensis DS-123]